MRISGQSILATVFPAAIKDGKDPVTFQGLNPSGETAFGYTVPNLLIDHAMRNPHVPAGFWRGVNVNHNAIYVECFMDELPFDRRGCVGVPAQEDVEEPEEPRGAQRRGREDRLGQAHREGPLPRPVADDGVRQLRGGAAEIRWTATRSRSTS